MKLRKAVFESILEELAKKNINLNEKEKKNLYADLGGPFYGYGSFIKNGKAPTVMEAKEIGKQIASRIAEKRL